MTVIIMGYVVPGLFILLPTSYLITIRVGPIRVHRLNGKMGFHRKVTPEKIRELELEVGLIKVVPPPNPFPPPMPSDSARSARPVSISNEIIMDNLARAYTLANPPICKGHRKKVDIIHPMDEPYPIEIIRPAPPRCLCNYAGCLDCNPPVTV